MRFVSWPHVINAKKSAANGHHGATQPNQPAPYPKVRERARMDHETLQALIGVYRARSSTDLLAIIMEEAEGPESRAAVLELLRSLSAEALADDKLAPVRRKASQFSLNAEDFELAERIARGSDLPEDKVMRARALHGLGRDQEAVSLYRQAISHDPAIRNRDLERLLGIRPGSSLTTQPAKIISLTSYSNRRENKPEPSRSDPQNESFFGDLDEASLTFADVAGLEEIKAEIKRRIVMPYLKPSLFERFKQKPGGSILLYGPPGCGKTLIAKATAGESDARFLSVNPEDILDKYAGEAEKRLRVFFDEARSDQPAILFFDDFDVMASRRASKGEAAPALISALLSELDSNQRNNSGVLVLASTNAPWTLDSAFFRSGRFQRIMFAAPPDMTARKKILGAALIGVPGAERISFDAIARKTMGFSGADLTALAQWACDATLARALAGASGATVTTALLKDGVKNFAPSAGDWLRTARLELRKLDRHQNLARFFAAVYRS